jgi:hypothetical protein
MSSEVFEIRVKGELIGSHWSRWFEGLSLSLVGEGETLIVGPFADQAALHGILARIRDLGLPLVALYQVPSPRRGEGQGEGR